MMNDIVCTLMKIRENLFFKEVKNYYNMTYNDFINGILSSRGRNGCNNEYHEKHHILPRCLGGSNDPENLIDLYAYEHFLAHKLLAIENPDNLKLVDAYTMMAFTVNPKLQGKELSPEEYEEARKAFSKKMKVLWADEKYRKMQSEIVRERWKNQEYRKFQSQNRTKLNNKMWSDPEFKKEMGQKVKERWENMSDEEMNKRKEIMREISNKIWKDKNFLRKRYTPVFCIETQEYFLCQQDAVKKYGVNAPGLSSHLKGKQKSAGKHPKTGEPLHWKKVTWEECRQNISKVCPSEKINLLDSSAA